MEFPDYIEAEKSHRGIVGEIVASPVPEVMGPTWRPTELEDLQVHEMPAREPFGEELFTLVT